MTVHYYICHPDKTSQRLRGDSLTARLTSRPPFRCKNKETTSNKIFKKFYNKYE
jgi:hypothetical protein